MTRLSSTRQSFFALLIFGFAVFCAQTLNSSHELDHQFHESQEFCAAFLAFDSSIGPNFDDAQIFNLNPDVFVLSVYDLEPKSSHRPTFSIRAPPAYS